MGTLAGRKIGAMNHRSDLNCIVCGWMETKGKGALHMGFAARALSACPGSSCFAIRLSIHLVDANNSSNTWVYTSLKCSSPTTLQ